MMLNRMVDRRERTLLKLNHPKLQ